MAFTAQHAQNAAHTRTHIEHAHTCSNWPTRMHAFRGNVDKLLYRCADTGTDEQTLPLPVCVQIWDPIGASPPFSHSHCPSVSRYGGPMGASPPFSHSHCPSVSRYGTLWEPPLHSPTPTARLCPGMGPYRSLPSILPLPLPVCLQVWGPIGASPPFSHSHCPSVSRYGTL